MHLLTYNWEEESSNSCKDYRRKERNQIFTKGRKKDEVNTFKDDDNSNDVEDATLVVEVSRTQGIENKTEDESKDDDEGHIKIIDEL